MNVWLILLIIPLPGLYDYCPKFKYWVKFSVYYFWLMSASLIMIPLSLIRPGSVENARMGAKMMNPLSRLLGIRWSLQGNVGHLSSKEPCVIVANHQSSVDLLGMFHIWDMVGRMSVIAKQSLMYYGSFGITAFLCGTVFIDRSNIKEAQAKINNVAQTLVPDKVKLWVFPEGTRNSDKKISLLPFKKGAFHVAQSCNLPILPIVGEGVITVLNMIRPEGKDVNQLLEETRQVMMDKLFV